MTIKAIVVLLLSVTAAISATGFEGNENIKAYYSLKNKAELYIVDSNYRQALATYKNAFALKKPNPLDAYNAFVVSCILKDSVTAKELFENMVLHGFREEEMGKPLFFERLKETQKDLYNYIISEYTIVEARAQKGTMPQYAAIMDSIFAADQAVRFGDPSQEQIRAMMQRDSANVNFIRQFIARYGFPDYDMVGVFERAKGRFIQGDGTLWMLLWHTRHMDTSLNGTLLDAVYDGHFSPDEYAMIIDAQAKQSVYYNILPRGKDLDNVTFLPIADEAAVNEKRAVVLLDSVGNFKRKLLYQNHANCPFYLVPAWAMILNFAPVDIRGW